MNATVTYRFDLYNDGGTRNCLFIAECFGDEHATLLARALFDSTFVGTNCIEVWRDDVLIHEAHKPPTTGIKSRHAAPVHPFSGSGGRTFQLTEVSSQPPPSAL